MKNIEGYIFPNIIQCNDINELKQEEHYFWHDNNIKLDDIYSYKRIFVFAEPGYGKTTLLNKIFTDAESKKYQRIFIDLKSISTLDFKDLLEMFSNKKKVNTDNIKISGNIKLQSVENLIICLDALDEVKVSELDNVINNIRKLDTHLSEAIIIVSARVNRADKYKALLRRINFNFLKILKFSRAQLKQYLDKNLEIIDNSVRKYKKDKIKKNIISIDSDIILIPRYLSYLLDLLRTNLDLFNKRIMRSDIMEKVLLKNISSVEREYEERMNLRVFGKLALAMEINQTKEISIDDFISFFEIIKSKVCERMYYRKEIKEIYDNTILKYNSGMIGFENAEIQEYLAAREISLLNEPERCLYKIVTDNPGSIIFPYWKNALTYFVEINPRSIVNILKHDYRSDINHESSITEIFSFVDLTKFTNAEMIDLSKRIYKRYQNIAYWIPHTIVDRLAEILPIEYLLEELSNYKYYSENIAHFLIGNQLIIVESFLKKGSINDDQNCKLKNLIIGIIGYNKKSVVQRYAVNILGYIADIEDLEKVYSSLNLKDELIERNLINVCSKKFYNSEFAVKIFYTVFKEKNLRFNDAYKGIMNISKSEYFISFLNKLLSNKFALNEILDHSSHDYQSTKKKSEIRKPSKELVKLISEIIEIIVTKPNTYYYAEKSRFFKELIRLLDKDNSMNSFKLFLRWKDDLDTSEEKKLFSRSNRNYLMQILSTFNSLKIFKYLTSLADDSKELESFAISLKWFDEDKYNRYSSEIEQILEKPIEIEEISKVNENLEKYKKFKSLLNLNEDKYNLGVFNFFNDNYSIITDKALNAEIKELKKIAENLVKTTNIDNVSITEGQRKKQYKISTKMLYFHEALKTLYYLGEDINRYRIKILLLIPYMELYTGLEFLEEFFVELSEQEITLAIQKWKQIDDVALKHNGISVLRFLKKLSVYSDTVYKFIFSLYNKYDYEDYEIIEIINYLDDLDISDDFLKSQLKSFGYDSKVGMCINKILIDRDDEDAIKWRFEKIKKMAKKHKNTKSFQSISNFESETYSLRIAESLMTISNKYEYLFIELINFSLEKYQEDEEYYKYVNYLWKIVKGFYKNKIEENPMLDLYKLQEYYNIPIEKKGFALFKYTLDEIINYHLIGHSKRIKFSDSVVFINKISQNEKILDNPKDFNRILIELIDKDLKRWVEAEGAYKMMLNLGGKLEDLFQKTIKGQIELACIKKGFEVKVFRESQSLDDKRPDFLLTYGFAGTQIIEVKRLSNDQVTNNKSARKYMSKLQNYIDAHNADNLIYLIVNLNDEKNNLKEEIMKLNQMYIDDKRIIVCGLDSLASAKK